MKYFILKFIAQVRAKIILTFNPKHYEKSLALRKGKCNQQGCCCGNCVNLTLDKKCAVYRLKYNGKDMCCWDFPKDDFDLWRIGVKGVCGYEWD